ncbi:MAG: NDP-sugar synthase [Acidobacteria bacterium]|nr:NDP-sugar synthase [Acidobacteriota bacterium]
MIPALVLTAGLATRLRPLSFVRAKAAVPVAGQPLITRVLRQLRAAGVVEAVLNLHHLPHTLTRIVGDGSDLDMRVRYSWEVPILGSAGGPRQALPLLGASTFLVANGDTLTDVDIALLVAAHRRSGALVTMAVMPNTEPQKYGGVVVTADGAVTGFAKRGSSQASYHFVGLQVAEAAAFASLHAGVPHESVAALYPALISARPGSVRAYVCTAEFLDIGTADDYLRTSLLLARREGGALHGARARIDPTARIEDSILWDDVEVGTGSMLRECIVADGACVPGDTSWIGVTLRQAIGALAPGERRIGELAVASL